MSNTQQQHKNMLGHCIADGRLELVSVLGLGAYGVVYLARDLTHPLHQQPFASTSCNELPMRLASSHGAAASGFYAVKVLNKVGLDQRQRRFQRREITLHTLASNHPNVVGLHRVIDADDDPCVYVIMDFCPDGDLFSMITEQQRYAIAQPQPTWRRSSDGVSRVADEGEAYWRDRSDMDHLVKDVFFQILDAVQFCHGLGIYHRDLKPENILCLQGGARVVLADFGLATGDKFSGDFGCGSTFYMGPECQGGITKRLTEYDTAANDVWSLGVILVNLICGRNPWKQACPGDETFREYLRNPDFLQDILPISDETNKLLKRIFTIREEWRCTLPELRKMVANISRFTATNAEMASRQEAARIASARARALAQAEQHAKIAEAQRRQEEEAAALSKLAQTNAESTDECHLEQHSDGAFTSFGTPEYWTDSDAMTTYDTADALSRQPSSDVNVDWAQHPIAAQPRLARQALVSDSSAGQLASAAHIRPAAFLSRPAEAHVVQTPQSPTDSERGSVNFDSSPGASSHSSSSRRSSASYTGLPPTPRFNTSDAPLRENTELQVGHSGTASSKVRPSLFPLQSPAGKWAAHSRGQGAASSTIAEHDAEPHCAAVMYEPTVGSCSPSEASDNPNTSQLPPFKFSTMPGRRHSPQAVKHARVSNQNGAVKRAKGQVGNLALAFQRSHIFGNSRDAE
ncbi:ran protein kinase [Ceraceosorus bombacis]|uniref:non-specific serine/threonine protein kinase n=1 Tax=Ceraceosorus bombacis TaxID=401625 RepID=A0A0P1BB75_9BASI|nr:ran protein kinase [Ceraceosorus bombacis]